MDRCIPASIQLGIKDSRIQRHRNAQSRGEERTQDFCSEIATRSDVAEEEEANL